LKTIILFLLFSASIFAQSPLLTLFDNDVSYAYDADVSVYLASMTTPLGEEQSKRIDTLVIMLKDSLSLTSLSDKFDVIYLFANETEESSMLNLAQRGYDAVFGSINHPTYTQNQGLQMSSVSETLIIAPFNPTTASGNYSLNSASVTIYSRTNILQSKNDFIANNLSSCRLRSSDYIYQTTNDAGNHLVANTDSRGIFTFVRPDANNKNIYKNGLLASTQEEVSTAIPNSGFSIPAEDALLVSDREYSFFAIGSSLTADDARKLKNVVEWYLDELGVGVIP